MFKNYIKSALRNSLRHQGYTLINILGLAVGLSVFLVLLFYIRYEQSFNNYHSKSDKIYRVLESGATEAGETKTVFTNWAMAGALKAEFPEIELMTRVFILGGALHTINESRFLERNYYIIEKSYFDVFDHKFLSGGIAQDIGSGGVDLVLTRSTAQKYFGNTDPIDKIVETVAFGPCRVVAVVEDVPLNSSFRPDFFYLTDIKMWSQSRQRYFADWEERNCATFLVLKDAASVAAIASRKEELLKANLGDNWQIRDFELQPMSDFHLKSVDIVTPTQTTKGNQQYIVIFGLIALFVLAIAVINYINLATARAIFRRKEVGIRKVVGASKGQLVTQFLVESLFISTIAFVTALGLVELSLPWFNVLTERNIDIPYFQEPVILMGMFGISLFVGFVSGIVPALLISAFQPGQVLRGFSFQKASNFLSRKVLVVFQFSLSIVMIIATIVVYRQMEYVQSKDMGFERERKLVVDINSGNVRRSFKTMKSEFLAHPDVVSVATVSRLPGEWKSLPAVGVTKLAGEEPSMMRFMGFDPDALATLNISLKAGSNFSGHDQVDSLHILINEKAAALLGGESILNQQVQLWQEGQASSFQVIGIVRDFNFESLYQEIGPMVIGPWNNPVMSIDYFVLNTKGDPASVLSHASAVHDKFDPEGTIEYNFLDQQWERYYRDDVKRGTVFALAAGLAIFIASLGLFGLASFSTSLRLKEFGIRKVLGATDGQLVMLISKEFILLVLIGFALASPIAWWLMDRWISTFAYHERISLNVFLLTGIAVTVVALVTVGYKSLNAARQNPVTALRNE